MISNRSFIKVSFTSVLLSFFALMVFFSQTSLAAEEKSIELNSVIPGQGNDTVDLGIAYHSLKKGFYGLYSVDGVESTTYGNTEIDFRVGIDLGFSQIYNMVSGNLDAGINFSVISAGAGASLANETAADSYTGSYTLFTSITPKKKLFIPRDNTGFQPTQAASDLVTTYPADILEHVGDEFVTCIEYGSYLLINMTIEYKNATDKSKIGGYLNVDWMGMVKVSGALSNVDETTKKSVKITIRAKQEGGDVIQLFDVIPDGIMSCSLDNPDSCFLVFENAVKYAKENYVYQLNELSDYNVVRLFTDTYNVSGPGLRVLIPSEGYPMLTYISQIALKNINQGWENAMLDKRRATNILKYYSAYLTTEHQQAVEDIQQKARTNAFRYAGAAEACMANPYDDYCRTIEMDTEAAIDPYDRSYLEISGTELN